MAIISKGGIVAPIGFFPLFGGAGNGSGGIVPIKADIVQVSRMCRFPLADVAQQGCKDGGVRNKIKKYRQTLTIHRLYLTMCVKRGWWMS